MAVIRLHDSIFEEGFREVTFDTTKSLIQQIEEMNNNSYESLMVECYDCETGETFFEPMVDEEGNQSVTIIVGKEIVGADYEVKSDDVIDVVFIPMAMARGWALALGAITGMVLGAGLGVGLYAAIYGVGAGVAGLGSISSSLGMIVAGLKGAAVGGLIGLYAGGAIWDKNNYKTEFGQNGEKFPEVRGASNQILTGNPYPFVIGKHLITPFINASPVTEYSGEYGEEAYIKVMHCAGYGPLKLTDFKLGEMMLAYNRSYKWERNTILSGLLKGHGDDDSGDILNVWNNNDIEIEIIQQLKDRPLNHGTIFPYVIKDSDVNTNVMFIADGSLSEQTKTVYKGLSYPSNFRSNTVRFTERCPMKFSVTLDFESGLYSSHTESSKSSSSTKYGSIPLWLAVQWRVSKRSNSSSDPNGKDASLWHDITVFNGKALGDTYTRDKFHKDVAAHRGNDLPETITQNFEKQYCVNTGTSNPFNSIMQAINDYKSSAFNNKRSTYVNYGNYVNLGGVNILDLKCTYKKRPQDIGAPDAVYENGGKYYTGNLANESTQNKNSSTVVYNPESQTLYVAFKTAAEGDYYDTDIGSDFVVYSTEEEVSLTLYRYSKLNDRFIADKPTSTKTVTVKNIAIPGNIFRYAETDYNEVAQYWIGKTLSNFQSWSGEDHLSQMRATATIDLRDFPEELKDMMDVAVCPTQSVEVRVIRVSPCYLNETGATGTSDGPYSYSDSVKWLSLRTEPFDEEKYLEDSSVVPQSAIKDEDLDGFCYVAFKAKADMTGNIEGSIGKFSCCAEAFAPYWDYYLKRWLPENVHKVTRYYGYFTDSSKAQKCDRANDVYEEEVTKEQFEEARQEGYSWIRKQDGSSYKKQIKDIVLSSCAYEKDGEHYFDSDFMDKIEGAYTYEETETEGVSMIKHNDVETALLSPSASAYNNNSVASGFMLGLVGPQNGIYAKGYEDIDVLSVADEADFGHNLKDGSRYNRDTFINGELHKEGEEISIELKCNSYIYQQVKLEELLSKIASCGRAMYTYDEFGRIKLVIDRKVDYPKGTLSQQNIISKNEAFSYDDNFAGYLVDYADEDNGYERSSFYCWAPGNSLKNYKGEVKPLSLAMVTNTNQAYSLSMYAMASSILQKDIITIKAGVEGNTLSLGDVTVVQNEDIDLSETSARIQELIIKDGMVRGFVVDGIYEYTDIRNEEGQVVQGVQITQPGNFGKSRVINLRLAEPTTIVIDDNEYTMSKGMTNVVIFDKEDIPENPETGNFASTVYSFTTGNIVMFGEFNSIGERYRIIKMKPENDGNFTFTLIPYIDEMYSYGDKLPVIHTSVKAQPVEKDFTTISEVPTTIAEQNVVQKISTSFLEERVSQLYANHVVTLYKRSTSEITEVGIESDLIYDFSTNTLTWSDESKSNGWKFNADVADEGEIYLTTATAFGNERTDTIEPNEWSTPVPRGKNGISTAAVYLYTRSNGRPAMPTIDVTYDFKTHSLSEVPEGWYVSVPTLTNDDLWIISATASSAGDTDVIRSAEWSNPSVMATNGKDGGYQDYVFLVGDFGMTEEDLRKSDKWTDAPPAVEDGKCLYMATKFIE